MAHLDFDFQPPSTHPSVWGAVLLLVGIIALGASLVNMQQAHQVHATRVQQMTALEQTLQKRRPPRTQSTSRSTADDATQLATARVRSNLDYSWQPAFVALQATFTKKIALISLEGSQAKKQLRIIGEARQLADAVAYANQLGQQKGVLRTALLQHEMQEWDAQHPVRFTLLVELRP